MFPRCFLGVQKFKDNNLDIRRLKLTIISICFDFLLWILKS